MGTLPVTDVDSVAPSRESGRGRRGARGPGVLPAPACRGRARADAHLACVPRRPLRLQAQEGRPLLVPRLRYARAAALVLRRGAAAGSSPRRAGLSRRACRWCGARTAAWRSGVTARWSNPCLRMRRLPAERMLPALLATDAVAVTMMERLAHRLVEFHRAAPTGAAVAVHAAPAALQARWDDTLAVLQPFVGRLLPAAEHALLAGLRAALRPDARGALPRASGGRTDSRRPWRPPCRARLLRRRARARRATRRRWRRGSTSSTASSSRCRFAATTSPRRSPFSPWTWSTADVATWPTRSSAPTSVRPPIRC